MVGTTLPSYIHEMLAGGRPNVKVRSLGSPNVGHLLCEKSFVCVN
jgi:hypothetical protein